MKQIFEHLSQDEFAALKEAIPLITILVGGADGKLDEDEVIWSEKVVNIRSYSSEEKFQDFYTQVDAQFDTDLQRLLEALPDEVDARSEVIARKLEQLNPVLAKIEPKYGHVLYKELLSFAKHVAKASGGILNFFAISAEEKKWLNLPMITPIEYEEEEEEQ